MKKKLSIDIKMVAKIALGVLALGAGIATVAIIGSTNMVPAKYFWVGATGWILLSALIGYGLFRSSRRHISRTVFAGLGAAVLVLASIITANFILGVSSFIDRVQDLEAQEIATKKGEITKPFVLYISGIDVRSHDLPFNSRSDVNILVFVNPIDHRVLTVNTPRDFYVDLPSFGAKDKLTHAGL